MVVVLLLVGLFTGLDLPGQVGAPPSGSASLSLAPATSSPSPSAIVVGPTVSAARCEISFDPPPGPHVLGRLIGSGFLPGALLTLVWTSADGTVTRHGGAEDPTLIANADGTMSGQGYALGQPDSDSWSVTDGMCTATIEASIK
ncbi:MAG: hypothetical protein ABI553_02845 [Chloroflexota bacterium]